MLGGCDARRRRSHDDGHALRTYGLDACSELVLDLVDRRENEPIVSAGVPREVLGNTGEWFTDSADDDRLAQHEVIAYGQPRLIAVDEAGPGFIETVA
jgi:hypothetical protein